MSDVWVSAAASVSILALLWGGIRRRSDQEGHKLIERLSAASRQQAPRARSPLLEGIAQRFAQTRFGSRIQSYASAKHPGVLFSDFVVWGAVAAIAGALAGGLLLGRLVPALILAGAAPALADRVVIRARGSRAARIEKQLPDALALQASALRAGQSLIRSLRIVAESTKSPLKDELEKMLNYVDLGMPVDDALEQLAARISSRDADLWIDAMAIHRQTGGNLAGVAESLAAKVSQRLNLRSEIRALTAQGRLSGLVVSGAPVAFFVMLSVGSRDQMEVLYTTPMGVVVMVTGLSLNALGLLWIKMVLRIKP